MGAFVEPDEDELRNASTVRRMKVFAAGPAMNLLVAFSCVLIVSFIFMPFVEPLDGVMVFYTIKDSPADKAGIGSWMLITELNGSKIENIKDFKTAMNRTKPGDRVKVKLRDIHGKILEKEVVLSEKYNFTNMSKDKGVAFLGVGITDILRKDLFLFKNPFRYSANTFLVRYYGAPFLGFFTGYNPLVEPYTNFYKLKGPFAVIPSNLFWMIVNAFYWIFWLNFAVGIFNALPIFPFDGGNLVQDGVKSLVKRLLKSSSKEGIDKIARLSTTFISFITLLLVLAPLLMKYFSAIM